MIELILTADNTLLPVLLLLDGNISIITYNDLFITFAKLYCVTSPPAVCEVTLHLMWDV